MKNLESVMILYIVPCCDYPVGVINEMIAEIRFFYLTNVDSWTPLKTKKWGIWNLFHRG